MTIELLVCIICTMYLTEQCQFCQFLHPTAQVDSGWRWYSWVSWWVLMSRFFKNKLAISETHVYAPPPNGQDIHEKERFEVRLTADRDRQARGGRDSRGGMESRRVLWQTVSEAFSSEWTVTGMSSVRIWGLTICSLWGWTKSCKKKKK